jgi:hypothetical protein
MLRASHCNHGHTGELLFVRMPRLQLQVISACAYICIYIYIYYILFASLPLSLTHTHTTMRTDSLYSHAHRCKISLRCCKVTTARRTASLLCGVTTNPWCVQLFVYTYIIILSCLGLFYLCKNGAAHINVYIHTYMSMQSCKHAEKT